MMAEESSDESAELVDKEEAVSAEKQFTSQQTGLTSAVTPPAPLPSFLTQSPGGSGVIPQPTSNTPANQQSSLTGQFVPQTASDVPFVPQTVSSVPFVPQAVSNTPFVPQASPGNTTGTQYGSPVSVTMSTGSPKPLPTAPSVPSTGYQSPGSPMSGVPPPPVSQREVTPPGPQMSPYEASSAINVPEMVVDPLETRPQQGGLFGWISGNRMLSKVVEKTKSSMESMITTLDPGMKEVIKSGGQVYVLVTSTKESKVGAVREAFQTVFGRATVMGKESQATTAAQPVGFTAGLKGAQERIQNLRQTEHIPDDQPVVSVEGFIVEMLPDRWYEMSCLVLQDPQHRIDLQTFSQPAPIPAEYILKAQDRTPKDYPLRWSGLAVTIGQIVEEELPHIGHVDWQNGIVGVSRRESLFLAAKSLAYMYRQRLPTAFVS